MLEELWLEAGTHRDPEQGMCAMEAVSWIMGEDHNDHPATVSPIIRHIVVYLNDALPDIDRQRLKPYLPRLIGTAWDGHEGDRARIELLHQDIFRCASPDVVAEVGFAMLDQMLALSEDSSELHEPELVAA